MSSTSTTIGTMALPRSKTLTFTHCWRMSRQTRAGAVGAGAAMRRRGSARNVRALNMAHSFEINPEALRRQFSVYVVIAQGDGKSLLYVGKTGDNREGCNPLIPVVYFTQVVV